MAKVTFDTDRCKGCGLCVINCPKQILAIDRGKLNKKGHPVAYCTEPEACVGCASCAMMCPDVIIKVER